MSESLTSLLLRPSDNRTEVYPACGRLSGSLLLKREQGATTSQLKHGLGDTYPAAVLQKLEAKLRILLLGHKNWVSALYSLQSTLQLVWHPHMH